jgi:hypothetical protein
MTLNFASEPAAVPVSQWRECVWELSSRRPRYLSASHVDRCALAKAISHHVAITSTLPGTASTLPRADISMDGRPTLRPAALQSMDDGVIARSAASSRVKVYLTERQASRLLCIGGGCNLAPFEELNHWRMP